MFEFYWAKNEKHIITIVKSSQFTRKRAIYFFEQNIRNIQSVKDYVNRGGLKQRKQGRTWKCIS